MISRRLLRIKVLQILYAYFKRSDETLEVAEKELFHCIGKAYELYHYLILLLFELTKHAEEKAAIARQKKIPTYSDLHPNMKFIENSFISQLRENSDLADYLKDKRFTWVHHPELIRTLYKDLTRSDFFIEYMASEERSYEEDKSLVIKILSRIVIASGDLSQNLEEQSIYWNDELDFVVSMIIRTIKKFRKEDGASAPLMDMFKNDEDRQFTKDLFRKTILHYDEYVRLIQMFSENWEVDRIAFLDILIMEMAICELAEFPEIPVKVTINEYIEIAKYYSTEKSGTFVNGILDRIVQHLRSTNGMLKTGRGLIGEV